MEKSASQYEVADGMLARGGLTGSIEVSPARRTPDDVLVRGYVQEVAARRAEEERADLVGHEEGRARAGGCCGGHSGR